MKYCRLEMFNVFKVKKFGDWNKLLGIIEVDRWSGKYIVVFIWYFNIIICEFLSF